MGQIVSAKSDHVRRYLDDFYGVSGLGESRSVWGCEVGRPGLSLLTSYRRGSLLGGQQILFIGSSKLGDGTHTK